jgi:hypothetical protein
MTRRTLGGELGNAYKILLGKHEKIKRPLVRHPRGLEDNIKSCNCYVRFDCFSLGVFLLSCFFVFLLCMFCVFCSIVLFYILYIDIFINFNWVVTRWQYTFIHEHYIEQHK